MTGPLVIPGRYSSQLYKQIEGEFTVVSDKVHFKVNPLTKGSLEGSPYDIVVRFWQEVYELRNKANDLSDNIKDTKKKINIALKAYERSKYIKKSLHSDLLDMRKEILELEQKIGGSKVRSEIGEQNEYPRMRDYLWAASGSSTYGPTEMHKQSLANAEKIFIEI